MFERRLRAWRIGWLRSGRKRMTELAVVVFGVLIALGLENVVQEWRWKLEGRDLEILAREEMEVNLAQAIERVAVDPCLRERVTILASGLVGEASRYAPQPATGHETSSAKLALPPAYQPPLRPWRTASIERLLNTEASKRVPSDSLLLQSRVLATIESIQREQVDEIAASGRILPLAVGIPRLTEEVRVTLLADLGSLDRARSNVELVSRRLIERGLELRVAPDPEDVEQRLNNLKVVWGDCVDVSTSLSISRELTARAF